MKERCSQFHLLGEPAKLRSTSESEVCELCRSSGQAPAIEPSQTEGPRRPRREASNLDPEPSARRFKNGLVAELFTQNGPFWESVRDVRTRWRIKPEKQLPPGGFGVSSTIMPKASPGGETGLDLFDRWRKELKVIEDKVVPVRFRDSAEWEGFISACVLCDPPKDKLFEFATHGDPRIPCSRLEHYEESKLPLKAAAPIRLLPDESDFEEVYLWLVDQLLEELGARHLQALGLDVEALVRDIFDNTDLNNEFWRRKQAVARREYIEIGDHVSKEDVGRAFDKALYMRRLQGETPHEGGAPERDLLLALHIAILHDDLNENDPTDKRRKRWTLQRLAEEHGLGSAGTARNYLHQGRQLRSKRKPLQ
jgi:hypothetical protein